jgi:hypothetical protein
VASSWKECCPSCQSYECHRCGTASGRRIRDAVEDQLEFMTERNCPHRQRLNCRDPMEGRRNSGGLYCVGRRYLGLVQVRPEDE